MKIGEATAICGTLSDPSKMPGFGTSTSPLHCRMGTILRSVPGSVCEGCYALGANYQYPSVKVAQQRRFAGLRDPRWVEAMVTLINRRVDPADPYFRWQDSGDIQGVWHLENIVEVARQTPTVKYWLPTKEKGTVSAFLRAGGKIPRNLIVRISGAMIDGRPPVVSAPIYSSTVHRNGKHYGRECPAPKQNGHCADCRACWSRRVRNVSYRKH